MSNITERDCHVWEKRVGQTFHSYYQSVLKGSEELKAELQWGRDNRAWIKLGHQSWTEWVKAFAKNMEVSESKMWRFVSELKQPRLDGETIDSEPKTAVSLSGESATVDSAPKTQIPLSNESEINDPSLITEDLPPIEVYLDKTKRQIPERNVAFFQEVDDQIRPIELLIRQLERAFADIYDPDDTVWKRLDMGHIKIYIHNLKAEIKDNRPWAWCPQCGGDGGIESNCLQCSGKGWCRIIEWSTVPEELKS